MWLRFPRKKGTLLQIKTTISWILSWMNECVLSESSKLPPLSSRHSSSTLSVIIRYCDPKWRIGWERRTKHHFFCSALVVEWWSVELKYERPVYAADLRISLVDTSDNVDESYSRRPFAIAFAFTAKASAVLTSWPTFVTFDHSPLADAAAYRSQRLCVRL